MPDCLDPVYTGIRKRAGTLPFVGVNANEPCRTVLARHG